jgi:hypothetical protein
VADTVLLKVPVGDGTDDFVEVQVSRSELVDLTESGVVLASASGSRFESAGYTLADAMSRVMPALRVILGHLRDGVHAPDEITMDVGLKVGGESGFVFAKGTAEATIAVSMTWRRGAAS